MKKIILFAALMVGGVVAVNAQAESLKTSAEIKQEAEVNKQEEQRARQLEYKQAKADVKSDKLKKESIKEKKDSRTFKDVSVSQVPQAVKDVLAQQHVDATISKASVNVWGVYKFLIVDATQDSGTRVVYINPASVSDAPASLKN